MTHRTDSVAVPDVPMSGPDINDDDVAALVGVLQSRCLSLGPELHRFERQIAARAGVEHAVGVSSGTAGLHLSIIAAGVKPADLVITTPFSFVASANCVLYERAVPVFVDVDAVTGNIDPVMVEAAVVDILAGGNRRRRWLPPQVRESAEWLGELRAIVAVHAMGQPADVDMILTTAHRHGVVVIEDSCEALGATYKHRPAGALADIGVFAFYPNKQITTGEGGMVVTNREDFATLCRSLRNQGRDQMDAWLRHDRLGYNYRMSELNAALGASQMARLDGLLTARQQVAEAYHQRLAGIAGLELPRVVASTTRMSWFTYLVRLAEGFDRTRVMSGLKDRGIPSRAYFSPIHLQPFYRETFGYRGGEFPVTESLGARSLALPFSPLLTPDQIDRVCDSVREVLALEACLV
jgi:dTDP-4-amino-4,6-dideoxygalactose transaminase